VKRVLVVHGPNLNMLGQREPKVYGTTTLSDIDARLRATASEHGVYLESFQSNSEGEIITKIQEARGLFDWLLINPAGLTHSSICLRDAIVASEIRGIEVHITNVYRRESFRHHSTIADVVVARVMGFGDRSYDLALRAALEGWAAP
jgi:3-dehydroquinate dehydratase-2